MTLDIENGVLIYYQDGYFKVGEIRKGVWTNRRSKWIGKLNPSKVLEINPNYEDYIVVGLPNKKKENRMQWFNFNTGEFVMSEGPKTDEEALQYIPNMVAAHGLFKTYRLMGKSIEESMIETLTACIGDTPIIDPPKPKKWWKFWSK